MIVERKRKREFWSSTIINFIPDLTISFSVFVLFDWSFFAFVGTLFGMQFVYLAIWLKNTLWMWARYKFMDRKRGIHFIVGKLKSNSFPVPEFASSG